MTLPTDYTNGDPVQQVRLLIADVDPDREVFTDEQLSTFAAMEAGSVKRAAAAALDAIAVSELLVSKVIRTQDLTTDGAKVAAELRARATQLRAQADATDLAADGGFFDVVAPRNAWPELTERGW